MAVNNETILAKAWLEGSNDYQQRIPDPTQAGIRATIDALFDPMNRQYYNYFLDVLINKIAFTIVRGMRWSNVLSFLKSQSLRYGATVEEIAVKWIQGHAYQDDAETLFKQYRPEAMTWYHSQNRRDKYAITVNREELRTAFDSEFGLNNLLAQIMVQPNNADEYDEYRIMLQLLAEYENRWGFFKHQLTTLPTDEASGKEFLTALRTYAGILQFPNTKYNAQTITDVPVFVRPSELMLMVTPGITASVDVNTLSAVFNLDKAESQIRKVIVDELPIANAVALLTTPDIYVCHDTLYENTSFFNPETLSSNYYLHHWGIYSLSPFVPAILFTTEEPTVTPKITVKPTGLTVKVEPTQIKAGETAMVFVDLTGSVTPEDGVETGKVDVKPDAATYEITTSGTTPLNSRTYIEPLTGKLRTQKSLEPGDKLTIKATSTYLNPSGETSEFTGTATVTIK